MVHRVTSKALPAPYVDQRKNGKSQRFTPGVRNGKDKALIFKGPD